MWLCTGGHPRVWGRRWVVRGGDWRLVVGEGRWRVGVIEGTLTMGEARSPNAPTRAVWIRVWACGVGMAAPGFVMSRCTLVCLLWESGEDTVRHGGRAWCCGARLHCGRGRFRFPPQRWVSIAAGLRGRLKHWRPYAHARSGACAARARNMCSIRDPRPSRWRALTSARCSRPSCTRATVRGRDTGDAGANQVKP